MTGLIFHTSSGKGVMRDKIDDSKQIAGISFSAVKEPDFDPIKKERGSYPVELSLTNEQDAKIRRKVDLHVMPLLCVVYGLQFVSGRA
jgi:hypothetical protein